jgi:FlaA1/EpsC-like NDP-sugar epimerase/lipopolysaccharide/colanic/teichoic acid biosynthesis glycosyltransferase
LSYALSKRCFDVGVSLLALIVLSPLLLLTAILVKLESPGPAFYRGTRLGRNGRRFRIWKLRTMRSKVSGPAITAAGDPRVTRVGRWLRRTKLDELPQFINVLKGDMSLVGPRPEDPSFVDISSADYRQLLSVRPGITSPASIAFADEEMLLRPENVETTYREVLAPAKIAMELSYLRRQSFAVDLAVLFKTLALAFPRKLVLVRQLSNLIRRHVPWWVIDIPIIALAFYAAVLFRFIGTTPPELPRALTAITVLLPALMVIYTGMNYLWGLHRYSWRYATTSEVIPILLAVISSTAVSALVDLQLAPLRATALPLSVLLLGGFLTFCGFVFVRYRWRLASDLASRIASNAGPPEARKRVLIYGAGDVGQLLVWALRTQKEGRAYEVVAFLDDDPEKRNMRIHGLRVLGNRSDAASIIAEHRIDVVIVAMHAKGHKLRKVLSILQDSPVQVRIAPHNLEWMAAPHSVPLVRDVTVEDLLGRQAVKMDRSASENVITDKVVLITGACGSIGAELCRQIAALGPRKLIALDNNETGLYELDVEMTAQSNFKLQVLIADVTDDAKMGKVFRDERPQIVFHVAAYKHVPLMERHPEEALRVNVGGTRITLEKARQYGAERFVFVSTDKAVNPSSVMGATKRLAEMLVTGSIREPSHDNTLYAVARPLCTAVRFGNVLGSRGSVVPTFAKQIELGGPVTVTHPEMTRYFMALGEAASLIIQAAGLTTGGDIFMLDMGERIRIDDLARKMIRMRGLRPDIDIPIIYSGIRPGEKLHEELTYPKEERRPTERPLIYRLDANGSHNGFARHAVDRLVGMVGTVSRDAFVEALLQLSQQPHQVPADRPMATASASARGGGGSEA